MRTALPAGLASPAPSLARLAKAAALSAAMVLGSSVAASAAPSVSPSDPSIAPAASSAPTPEQRQAATDLLTKVRQMTATLDQLDGRYLSSLEAANRAAGESWIARAELEASRSRYRQLLHRAAHAAVNSYVATSMHSNTLEQFTSGQEASAGDVTRVYGKLAGAGLARKVDSVRSLRTDRRRMSDLASASAEAAKRSAKAAKAALGDGRRAEAKLLALFSSLDPGTKVALEDLQRSGDSAVADLLRTGDLALPPGVDSPPPVLGSAIASVAFATAQIGKPYLWGGSGPDAFDCSGLVQQAWAAAGVGLPRVAADQFRSTVRISFAELQPGDLVFFERPIGHVGIYVGLGMMIDAPHAGADVRLDSIFWKDLAGFGRVSGS